MKSAVPAGQAIASCMFILYNKGVGTRFIPTPLFFTYRRIGIKRSIAPVSAQIKRCPVSYRRVMLGCSPYGKYRQTCPQQSQQQSKVNSPTMQRETEIMTWSISSLFNIEICRREQCSGSENILIHTVWKFYFFDYSIYLPRTAMPRFSAKCRHRYKPWKTNYWVRIHLISEI